MIQVEISAKQPVCQARRITMTTLLHLQNGTDIRGIALENEHALPITLSKSSTQAIAVGFINWIAKMQTSFHSPMTLSIGTDSRLSGSQLKEWLTEVFVSYGIHVIDVGLATTPAMFMSTVFPSYQADAAIMITASHLPYFYNGFKFFTKDGGLEKHDITYILNHSDTTSFPKGKSSISKRNLIADYSAHLIQKIREETNCALPLKGVHIIVDAGNGAGGFFVEQILTPLGADTTGSQFLEPNGLFPNHIPNPENKEAMHSVSYAVTKHHADLGIIFDTDVDRAAVVLSDGKEINRNRFIALLSAITLEEHPQSVIVTDSVTSSGLAEFIQAHGGIHHRFKRGYRNVINEGIRINRETDKPCYLAIETSGHGAMAENSFLDDGAYLVAKILISLSKWKQSGLTIEQILSSLKEPAEEKEYRIPILHKNFKDYATAILSDLQEYILNHKNYSVAPKNYEGLKILTPTGWFLIRISLHEPLLVLNMESNTEGGIQKDLKILYKFFANYKYLHQNVLK